MPSSFFVTQTNPEIFCVLPRPGGIATIKPQERTDKEKNTSGGGSKANVAIKTKIASSKVTGSSKSKTSKIYATSKTSASSKKSLLTTTTAYGEPFDLDINSCPRQYKVKQAIVATPWSEEFIDYLEPTDGLKRIPEPFQNAVDMLAMTISVIMLLSRGYNTINESHFKWVFSYLKCIKDEFGKTPPNVQGILNHINNVTEGKIKSFLDDDEPAELEEGEKGEQISPKPPADEPGEPEPPAESEAE